MTETEKLIWAVAYAAEWSRQYARLQTTGVPMHIPECVENAGSAVVEARASIKGVEEGWGEDHETTGTVRIRA